MRGGKWEVEEVGEGGGRVGASLQKHMSQLYRNLTQPFRGMSSGHLALSSAHSNLSLELCSIWEKPLLLGLEASPAKPPA